MTAANEVEQRGEK